MFSLINSSMWRMAFCKLTFSKSISSRNSRIVFLSISVLILPHNNTTSAPSHHGPSPAATTSTYPPTRWLAHWASDSHPRCASARTPHPSTAKWWHPSARFRPGLSVPPWSPAQCSPSTYCTYNNKNYYYYSRWTLLQPYPITPSWESARGLSYNHYTCICTTLSNLNHEKIL